MAFIVYEAYEVVSFIWTGARYLPHCVEPVLLIASIHAHSERMKGYNQMNERVGDWINQERKSKASFKSLFVIVNNHIWLKTKMKYNFASLTCEILYNT